MNVDRNLLLAAVLIIATLMAAAQQPPQLPKPPMRDPVPNTFTNLQVLPKDIAKADLVRIIEGLLYYLRETLQLLPCRNRRSVRGRFCVRREGNQEESPRSAALYSGGPEKASSHVMSTSYGAVEERAFRPALRRKGLRALAPGLATMWYQSGTKVLPAEP